MSDDTPTRRYPEGFPPPEGTPPPGPQDAMPTERFAAPVAGAPLSTPPGGFGTPPTVPPSPPPAPPGGSGRNQKGLIIALAVIGGVLLLVIIGLLIWIGVSSGSPSASPTPSDTASASPTPSTTPSESPSPTPSETPSQAPQPPPPPPKAITSYTTSTQSVDCSGGGPVPVTFSWAANGETLWFGVGTDDARAEPYGEFPLNYTMDFDYQCGQTGHQQRYTITVLLADGSTQSQTIVIREQ